MEAYPQQTMTDQEFDRVLELYQQDKLPAPQRAAVEQWLETKAQYNADETISEERLAALKADFMRRISKGKSRTLIPTWVRVAAAIACADRLGGHMAHREDRYDDSEYNLAYR